MSPPSSAAPVAHRQDGHRAALTREILKSERQRARALVIVLSIILALTLAIFLAPWLRAAFPQLSIVTPITTYVPFILYELMVIRLIGRRLASGRDIPRVARFASALIETSLPTVVLNQQIEVVHAEIALGLFAPLLYFLFIVLSTLRLDFWLSLFTGFVAGVQLFVMARWYGVLPAGDIDPRLALAGHLSRSLVLFAGGVIAGWVGTRLRRQFEATLEATSAHDRVTNLFGQHVSPQVVDRLLASGAGTLSEMRRVAVMFVDIRSFTAAARSRQPAEVVARLDSAFAVLVEIVDRNGGVVNKFLGDGFLALFGAPLADARATQRAVIAGREMLEAIALHNLDHADWPIRIGIAVHVGDTVTGTVGSPRRKEYTVIGDTVNLAARIEGLNKEFGAQFLISNEAHLDAGAEAAEAIGLGDVAIRGYDAKVPLWRLA
ncbi:adenylate cyclase [Rhizobiales bacterium GAS191]|nr:adenylate cyclase [Rhizobiales bacterium GAS113]SED59102.1 adenylate cyclase [Rhizobiales bacterium GAS191]SEE77868.1 adenylate cyclase [Rhizobiales bacterium GAS188]